MPVPLTHTVNVERAMETLGHREMVALSRMFHRWALTEERISPEQRTKMILWSADYERVAEYVGESWRPSDPDPREAIALIAKLALRDS